MLFAVLGDIHGNLPALEAVLRDVDAAGIQTIICTGDLVAGAPQSNEVVECIRTRAIPCVQGDTDRLTVRYLRKQASMATRLPQDELAAIGRAFDQLGSQNLEFLRGLPKTLHLTLEGIEVAVCHGTLNSQSDSFDPDGSIELFRRQRERATADIVLCGRSHQAFDRWVDGTLFVNPGAAGLTPGTAPYALIDTDSDPWAVELRSASYN